MSRIRGRGNERTEKNIIDLFRHIGVKGWRRHVTIHFPKSSSPKSKSSDEIVFKSKVRPDFIFPKLKITLFVDGCFWHGCPKCYRLPKSRKKFWSMKIQRNRERDRFQSYSLRRMGWRVIRVRECSLLPKRAEATAKRLKRLISSQ